LVEKATILIDCEQVYGPKIGEGKF